MEPPGGDNVDGGHETRGGSRQGGKGCKEERRGASSSVGQWHDPMHGGYAPAYYAPLGCAYYSTGQSYVMAPPPPPPPRAGSSQSAADDQVTDGRVPESDGPAGASCSGQAAATPAAPEPGGSADVQHHPVQYHQAQYHHAQPCAAAWLPDGSYGYRSHVEVTEETGQTAEAASSREPAGPAAASAGPAADTSGHAYYHAQHHHGMQAYAPCAGYWVYEYHPHGYSGYHGMLMAPQYQYSAMAMPYSSHPMQYSSHPHGHNSRVATSHSRGHLGRSASAASGFARHERAAHAAAHVATKSAGVSATSSSGGWAARRSNEDGGDGCAASTSGRASDAPPAGDDEPEPLQCGWGSLTVAILQSVVARLGEGDVKHVRRVCRHWRSVADANLESLTPSDLQARTLVARFPNLRALHLTHCANIRNRSLMIISGAGLKLHTLSLGDDSVAARPWVTNEGLACIAHMTSLTSLHLHDCNGVTNNGLLALAGLHRLSTLSLKGCRKLTSGAFEALQGHSGLTHLNLHGCRVTDKGLAPLVSLGLVSLQLGNTRVRDEGLSYLAQITTLRELHFDHENLTDVGVAQLSTLTQLESLALRDCAGVSGDSLSVLIPALTNLLSLDLYKNYTMDDSELSRCLDLLGAVTYLDLRGTPVTEDGLQQLTKLSCLQKLCLAPTNERLWSPYLCVVSNLTQLTSLSINNCTLISWAELEALRQLKLLRELDLSHDGERRREHGHHGGHNGGHNGHDGDHAAAAHCMRPEQSVNPTAINAMAAITSLTSIDLSRRAVHEEHLSALAEKLPRLHNLIIIGCPVLYTEIQSLQRRFPDLMIHRKPLHDVSCSSSEFGER